MLTDVCKKNLKLVLVLLCVPFLTLAGPVDAMARDTVKAGPKIGAQIPGKLAAVDQNGKQRSFENIKGNKGLILIFSRSLHW